MHLVTDTTYERQRGRLGVGRTRHRVPGRGTERGRPEGTGDRRATQTGYPPGPSSGLPPPPSSTHREGLGRDDPHHTVTNDRRGLPVSDDHRLGIDVASTGTGVTIRVLRRSKERRKKTTGLKGGGKTQEVNGGNSHGGREGWV